jgi:NADH:ubiquinone oxidoreductase subunit 6 (subunit J)
MSALWLAGTSALVSVLLYLLGAHEVAVIELSVGAGLVTVLFVFAINIAGEEAIQLHSTLPRVLIWLVVLAAAVLLGAMIFPGVARTAAQPAGAMSFATALWVDRKLDVILQVVLIFAGVLGVLGLLSEGRAHSQKETRA